MKRYDENLQGSVAQGEILFLRVSEIPETATPQTFEGDIIVGHSETGHHHVLERPEKTTEKSKAAQMLIDKTNKLIAYLQVKEESHIVHKRPYDTHETIVLPPGNYVIRYRAEDTPQGWQRVMD